MRSSGLVGNARGFSGHAHVCWRYDEHVELAPRVREFLGEGLARGERVSYIGSAPAAALLDDLRALTGFDDAVRRGAVEVASLTDIYATTDTVVEPAEQVRAYAAATAAALAAGYTGLRVAAEATPLVRTPAQLEAFTRYEHLVDRFMATRPFSALCAYHGGELGEDVVEQLACLHPATNQDTVAFRLYAPEGDEHSASLGGELDISSARLFGTALDRAEPPLRDGALVVDARDLTFVDHRTLLRLLAHARRRAATLVLHTAHPGPERLVRLLDLPDVRVESRREGAA